MAPDVRPFPAFFTGGDGRAYEVRGTPGRVFNLVSAPWLSVNAQFLEVPPSFRAEDITDTVLGSVGVALCDDAEGLGASTSLTFSIDGRLAVRQEPRRASAAPGGHEQAAPENATAAEGRAHYALEHSRMICNLSAMGCSWHAHNETPLDLPLYDGGHSRIKVRTRHSSLTITRHAMVDLGTAMEVDCQAYARWSAAAAACTAVQQASLGSGSEDDAKAGALQESLLLLLGPTLRPEQRFHFMEVELDALPDVPQHHVHGLLGQRALLRPDASLTPTTAVGVTARGGTMDVEFGAQGEGAIEGVYTEYIVAGLDDHGRGDRYTRFSNCEGRAAVLPV